MKSTLIFDFSEDSFYDIEYTDNDTNEVELKFINCDGVGTNPHIEFHKTEKYVDDINVNVSNREIMVTIPTEYINDGYILHFRYADDTTTKRFYHLLGDITQFEVAEVKVITPAVFEFDGENKPPAPPTPPEPPTPTCEHWKLKTFFNIAIQKCVKKEG